MEYIDFDQFDLIENTNKGGAFSTVYSAIWMEGPRWVWDEDAEQWTRNGPIKVALKRLNNSQNMSEEYLKLVGYNFFYKKLLIFALKFIVNDNFVKKLYDYHRCLQSGSAADCFGITKDLLRIICSL